MLLNETEGLPEYCDGTIFRERYCLQKSTAVFLHDWFTDVVEERLIAMCETLCVKCKFFYMKKMFLIFSIFCLANFQGYSQLQADSAFYKSEQSVWLTKKTGFWDVTMTLQPSANEAPMVIKKLEAERTMVGALCLHEVMHQAKGATMPAFQRYADLGYNYNDSRWDYMSIDTRVTAGIMFFSNMPDVKDSIVSYMLNTVHPGFGPGQTGRGKNLRVKNVVITINPNHDMVKQYWKLTDGDEWLAVTYDYVKRK